MMACKVFADRVCRQCPATFAPRRYNQVTCSPECRKADRLAQQRARGRAYYWGNIEQCRQMGRDWYARNRDRHNARTAAWLRAHPDRRRLYRKRYYWSHREKDLAAAADWRRRNLDRDNARRRLWRWKNWERVQAYQEKAPQVFSLDAPGGVFGTQGDRTADARVADPATVAFVSDLRSWLGGLSEAERAVVTAYADNGLDAAQAAAACGLRPPDFTAVLSAVQSRARHAFGEAT